MNASGRVRRAISLHDLVGRSPRNCRTDVPHEDLAGTIASIEAVGQLQPLIVSPHDTFVGRFWIDDGGRRWQAMCALRDMGRLDADHRVDCDVLVDGDGKSAEEGFAREVSLQANLNRRELHPVDQCAAFGELVAAGCSVDTVAKHFALPLRTVNQRLRLRQLSPRVREAWRDGRMSAEAAAAFTAGAGHVEQDALLDELSVNKPNGQFDPTTIRARLRKDALRTDSAEARFVGLDAYVAAGGSVDDNLFEDFALCRDGALLKRLARKRLLEDGSAAIATLGLGTVCLREDVPDYGAWTALPREYTALEAGRLDEEELSFADAITIEVKAIARKVTPAQMVATTLVMYLDGEGPRADVGMVAPPVERAAADSGEARSTGRASAGKENAGKTTGATGASGKSEAEPRPSDRPLIEAIDRARVAGAAEALIDDPDLALIVAVAALQARDNRGPVRLSTMARNDHVVTPAHGGFAQALDAFAHETTGVLHVVCRLQLAEVVAASLRFGAMDRDAIALLAAIAAAAPDSYRAGARESFDYPGFIGALAKDRALALYVKCGGLAADARRLTRLELTDATVNIARDKGWLPSALDLPPPDTRLLPLQPAPLQAAPLDASAQEVPPLAEVMVEAIKAHEAELAAQEILVGPDDAADAPAVDDPAPQLTSLDAFFAARTRRRDGAKVKAAALFAAYRDATPINAMSQTAFGSAVAALGIGKHRSTAGWHYLGIELAAADHAG